MPASYQGRPKKLDGEWGATIERADIDAPDAQIPRAIVGKHVELESRAGKKWTQEITGVHDISDRTVAVQLKPLPERKNSSSSSSDVQAEPGAGNPNDDVVTRENLREWFHAVMKALREQGVDVEPVKAAMLAEAAKLKWTEP